MTMEKSPEIKTPEELKYKFLGRVLVDEINKPTPKEWVESRPIGGGGTANYLPGWRFTQRLNEVFGFLWSEEVREVIRDGDHIVSKVRVSVKFPAQRRITEFQDGHREIVETDAFEIFKDQFGGAEIKRYSADVRDNKTGKTNHKAGDLIDLANDYKASATDGKKRCGLEFGFFLDIYSMKSGDESGPSKQQLDVILMRGKKLGWTDEETGKWVLDQTGKEMKDCETMELMGLVPKLIGLEKERKDREEKKSE